MEEMAPVASTCPWVRCPPRGVLSVSAVSRFTGSPSFKDPRLVRLRVSGMVSREKLPSPKAFTVRHVPLTAMLSPSRSPSRQAAASTLMEP